MEETMGYRFTEASMGDRLIEANNKWDCMTEAKMGDRSQRWRWEIASQKYRYEIASQKRRWEIATQRRIYMRLLHRAEARRSLHRVVDMKSLHRGEDGRSPNWRQQQNCKSTLHCVQYEEYYMKYLLFYGSISKTNKILLYIIDNSICSNDYSIFA